ncbi:MAG: hypothetical protein RL318_528 [Fibrobacterota bacterium]|jgi:hypothetical protein
MFAIGYRENDFSGGQVDKWTMIRNGDEFGPTFAAIEELLNSLSPVR